VGFNVQGKALNAILALIGIGMLFPLIWMAIVSVSSSDSVMVLDGERRIQFDWSNYRIVWETLPLARYFGNSLWIVAVSTIVGTAITICAAFAFSTFQFYGKNVLLSILLASLMVPQELLFIPNYMTVAYLGWVDSYAALTIPWMTNAFAVFYLVQSFSSVPREYLFAARADGCSVFIYLWKVLVPLAKQPIMTLMLLKSIGNWNSYLWPLIVTNSKEMRTLPVGLLAFSSEAGTSYELLMAASVIVVVPICVLYFVLQKPIFNTLPQQGNLKF